MLPKLLPMPLPVFVLRHALVKSMNPTGMIVTLPRCNCSGADSGALSGCGSGAGTTGEPNVERPTPPGMIGVVLATSPRLCCGRIARGVSAPGRSRIFCCASTVRRSSSICFC